MWKYILPTLLSLIPLLLLAQHNIIVESGTQARMSGGYLVMTNAVFNNSGDFQSSLGTTIVRGTASAAEASIGGNGNTQFSDLEIDKASNDTQLTGNIEVTKNTTLISGNLDLNGYDLLLGSEAEGNLIGESETSRIFGPNGGEIIKEITLNAPSNQNPGNIGLELTSASNFGYTTIRRGHASVAIMEGEKIARYFDISPSHSVTNANMLFHYWDAELNSLAENNLVYWQAHDYTAWSRTAIMTQNQNSNIALLPNTAAMGLVTLGTGALFVTPRIMLPSNYDNNSNTMLPALLAAGLLPSTEPYTALGYSGLQNAGITTTISISGTFADVIDWALVELRDANTPSDIVAVRAALLRRDGQVVDIDGQSAVPFTEVAEGNYYIAVRHRNHLGVMSAAPVLLSY